VRKPDGTPIRLLGAHNEITKLKETEKQLRELLEEKTALLQEVNHRVKNNLAAVSSLVNLKSASLVPEADLSDIRSHIEAIRFVYEQLSQSHEADNVEVAGYISGLVAAVFRTQPRVSASVNIETLVMRAREATALGLIVNELAMNAMKHGRVENEPMEFRVSSTSVGKDGELAIEVSNTGRPIPEDVELTGGKTLGLRLVSSLAKQLGGRVAMRRADAAFTITLPTSVAV
jgi:two-component sensor histidine kinase